MRATFLAALWVGPLFFLVSCGPLADPYSPEAFRQATSIKAQSLALIDKGTAPYANHRDDADDLLVKISEAYEFARGRGRRNSDEAAGQWAIILDPDGGSVGDFVRQWQESGRLNSFFVDEFGETVALQFDEIIELETGRNISDE